MDTTNVVNVVKEALASVGGDTEARVAVYNEVVRLAAEMVGFPHPCLSPRLVPGDKVRGNEYNPNVVAPPEMRLLTHSIRRDGVTMAIVVAAVNQSVLGPDPTTRTIPLAAIGLIIGVDRVLDMCRTSINVWGDAVGAMIISRTEPDEPARDS